MRIGVPTEIKTDESRVGLVPFSVRELSGLGHTVTVQSGAGDGVGCDDETYRRAGARIAPNAAAVFEAAELIVKVKEPQPSEVALLEKRHTLFTYLHLAPEPRLTDDLVRSGCTAIAYETVTDQVGGLPLLAPMSEVAGRMAVQAGAHFLERPQGGAGILLGGVPGVPAAKVVVIGGGVVGTNAAHIAVGMGADVVVIDKSIRRLRELDVQYGNQIHTAFATAEAVEHHVTTADLVVGAVLVPGRTAPKIVTRDLVRAMARGSVIVDVAIDQGGMAETSRATTHSDPVFTTDGVVHYCVANMPGAVARTSAFSLNNATLPFVEALANLGVEAALGHDPHLRAGLNIYRGSIVYEGVAEAQDKPYLPAAEALGLDARA